MSYSFRIASASAAARGPTLPDKGFTSITTRFIGACGLSAFSEEGAGAATASDVSTVCVSMAVERALPFRRSDRP